MKEIINRFRIFFLRIIKKDLVQVFSFSGVSTLVKMITGIVRTKVVALLLGPSGVAIIGQMADILRMTSLVSNAGITQGVTKYIAEFKDDVFKIKQILSTAFKITLIASILTGLFLIFFSGFLSNKILLDGSYKSIFIVFGFSIILFAINRLLLAIINGFKDFKNFIKINIASNITILFYSVGLIYFFGVYGALLSQVTSQSIVLIISIIFIFRSNWFKKQNFIGSINTSTLKQLSGFTLLTIFTFFLGPISKIVIRSFLINGVSIDAAGYWDSTNKVSGLVLQVVTQALTVYLIPRFSELKERTLIRKEILNTYKIIIPILIISFSAIYIFRDFIISVLYSSEFYPMRELFLFQFVGDTIKIISWVISIQLVAKAMIKTLFVTEIFGNILIVVLSYFFINFFGLKGVVYAFTVNYTIYLLMMLFIFRKTLFYRNV